MVRYVSVHTTIDRWQQALYYFTHHCLTADTAATKVDLLLPLS